VNGKYYMNANYGSGLELGRLADAFLGLAAQTGGGSDSWVDRLVDHLTAPGMPPEAYDDMKVNKLTVRQVANVIANEDRDVTPGISSPEQLQESKLWKAHAIINADRAFGDNRQNRVHTAPSEVTAELANSEQYKQALAASRTAFQQQLAGQDPTNSRMYFNNRFNENTGPRQLGTERQGMVKRFGPFQYGQRPVYTVLFENLKGDPQPRRR
jgi:hypothetical protein